MRLLLAFLGFLLTLPGQTWLETLGRSPAGTVALHQAALDVGTDTTALLVASHPDDRYVLLAAWLRYCHGVRIAVLLATRGGGGQNSTGPEVGDALERLRTLEAEAGCSRFDGEVWYLDRPDCGFRRSAEETFAEWGREETLRGIARVVRKVRPDVVLTTHNAEETHGHDLAIVELLPAAVALAADPGFASDAPPHRARAVLLGAGSTGAPDELRVPIDRLEPNRGETLRRLAWELLAKAHTTPGAPTPMDTLFEPEIRLQPIVLPEGAARGDLLARLPGLFDAGIWPGERSEAESLGRFLGQELPEQIGRSEAPIAAVRAALIRLRAVAAGASGEVSLRASRRVEALERLLLLLRGLQLEVDVMPGTAAIAGEEFVATVRLHSAGSRPATLRAEGLDGVAVTLESFDGRDLAQPATGPVRAQATIRIPLAFERSGDPMARRFHGDRFVPPVRIRFQVGTDDLELPVVVVVPVVERAPVELDVVPRMLLLPTSRQQVQFGVAVTRNSQFPVDDQLEVRAPAGYVVADDHRQVSLRDVRSDLYGFEVQAAPSRNQGVDILRISLGGNRVALPVHKIDVQLSPTLRVGVLRGRDDTLANVLGVGGFGLRWVELSDADVAVADLRQYDTIVVDVRALRDRPLARRAFRRLLEFSAQRGHRLLVLYQKDVEFHPPGEGFLGAPLAPFQVGKARVTRPDAPVRVLKPDHVLLEHPNQIRPGDWDGWDQERGLYFPSVYAAQYEEILEMQDPGQPVERGALLYVRNGEGEYVYCALALWRQLKKLHPGAVRLLANLLTPDAPR